MNETRLIELLEKFYCDSLTDLEKSEFESILDSNEESREFFRAYNFAQSALSAIELGKQRPLRDTQTNKQTKHDRNRPTLKRLLRAAAGVAAACLLVGSTLFAYHKLAPPETPVSYCEVINSDARVTTILLPDSSIVHLFSGSKIRFPNIFDTKERIVELTGEAMFEVKSNRQHPFFVNTSDGTRVMAYGTKFNVCGYPNENSVSAYLIHGNIDFIIPHSQTHITLSPQMSLSFDRLDKSVSINRKAASEFLAMESGILLFDNTPLDVIMTKLSRTYHVQIECQDFEAFKYSYTGSFKDESIYQVMDILAKSSPHLKWKKSDETYIFSKSTK